MYLQCTSEEQADAYRHIVENNGPPSVGPVDAFWTRSITKRDTVLQKLVVKFLGRKFRDGWMHAILHIQHAERNTVALKLT